MPEQPQSPPPVRMSARHWRDLLVVVSGLAIVVAGIADGDRAGWGLAGLGVMMMVVWGCAFALRPSVQRVRPWPRNVRVGLTIAGFLLGALFIYWTAAIAAARHGEATLDCRGTRFVLCEANVRWAGGGTSTVVVDRHDLETGTRIPVIDGPQGLQRRPPWPEAAAYLLVGLLMTGQAAVSAAGLVIEKRRDGPAETHADDRPPRTGSPTR